LSKASALPEKAAAHRVITNVKVFP